MGGWHWVRVAACLVAVLGGAGCREGSARRARTDLEVSPATLEFGPSAVGATRTLTVRVSNRGRAALTIQRLVSSLPSVELTETEPFSLPSGAERELSVRFTPAVEGRVQGVVEVVADDGGEPARVDVSGVGIKAWVEVSSRVLDFGSVELGRTEVRELLLRNPTEVESEPSLQVVGAEASQFSLDRGGLRGLAPGEQRRVRVTFHPDRLGAVRSALQVALCAGCAPMEVALVGTGIASLLEVSPLRVDFGRVSVGASAEQRVVLRNLGNTAMQYDGVQVLDDAQGAFRVSAAPQLPGNLLQPGATAEVRVVFSPRVAGPFSARLAVDVRAGDSQHSGLRVALLGEGGSSCVGVQPGVLDFGVVALGMSATRSVRVHNRCRGEVVLGAQHLNLRSGGYFTLAQAPTALPIAPGQSATVALTFLPRAEGPSEAGLSLEVREGSSLSTEVVEVRGEGRNLPPCQSALEPASLDFRQVPLGVTVTLGVAVRNVGPSACYLASMQLAAGSDEAFSAEPMQPMLLEPGRSATLRVSFNPTRAGHFQALAEAWVNPQGSGHLLVPVSGEGVEGCFSVEPATLEFGTVRLACAPGQRELKVANRCPGPITLQAIELDGTDEFLVTHGLLLPQVLPPGAELRLPVTYRPRDGGEDMAALRFSVAGGASYTAGLGGIGLDRNELTDVFIQQSQAKVDVLFVVDNSGSMMDEQQNLGSNFTAFLSHARASQADYQIAVTTTGIDPSPGGWSPCPGGVQGGEAGRFFPVDNSRARVITPSTPNAELLFSLNTQVGVCHWNEQGLEAARRALSPPLLGSADDPRTPQPDDGNGNFLRGDARLALIFLSDEEDFSPQPVSVYEEFFLALKDHDRSKLIASAIVAPEDLASCPKASSSGTRYLQLARATGGVEESICTPNWAASLERLSESAFSLDRVFRLTERPLDSSRISVHVDGRPQESGWSYDSLLNAITFSREAVPPPGSVIEVTYPVGCP